VTWEVEGVILFLRNRLPPLIYASHITTSICDYVWKRTCEPWLSGWITGLIFNIPRFNINQLNKYKS